MYNWSIGRITPLLALLLIAVDAHLLVTYAGLPGQLLETFPLMYQNLMTCMPSTLTQHLAPRHTLKTLPPLVVHVINALPRNIQTSEK